MKGVLLWGLVYEQQPVVIENESQCKDANNTIKQKLNDIEIHSASVEKLTLLVDKSHPFFPIFCFCFLLPLSFYKT